MDLCADQLLAHLPAAISTEDISPPFRRLFSRFPFSRRAGFNADRLLNRHIWLPRAVRRRQSVPISSTSSIIATLMSSGPFRPAERAFIAMISMRSDPCSNRTLNNGRGGPPARPPHAERAQASRARLSQLARHRPKAIGSGSRNLRSTRPCSTRRRERVLARAAKGRFTDCPRCPIPVARGQQHSPQADGCLARRVRGRAASGAGAGTRAGWRPWPPQYAVQIARLGIAPFISQMRGPRASNSRSSIVAPRPWWCRARPRVLVCR